MLRFGNSALNKGTIVDNMWAWSVQVTTVLKNSFRRCYEIDGVTDNIVGISFLEQFAVNINNDICVNWLILGNAYYFEIYTTSTF